MIVLEPAASAARPYDFRRPVRLGADVHARLATNQDALATALAHALGESLGMSCDIAVREVTEGASDRLFATPYDPVFRLAPLGADGTVFVRIGAQFAQAIVDRVLGGAGAPREVAREPTAIEAALLALAVADWRPPMSVGGMVPAQAPVFVDAAERHASEAVDGVCVAFDVTTSGASDTIEVFYVYAAVQHMLALDGAAADVCAPQPLSWRHLEPILVRLRVLWPPTPIRIRDLRALRVGDVVHLDHKLGDELVVMLGDRVAFRAQPGAVDASFGVCITRNG